MNKRIEELAQQAGLKVEYWMTNPPKPSQILGSTEQFEKFAELIVRECAKVARNTDLEDIEGGDSAVLGAASDAIENYFGVTQ